ncbi:MAG: AraC family transcriptional regulator [Oscillospiraceae bacterium]|nr:AraC family transcriptional regulator [Oscillospiraceae bacterium]
MDWIDRMNQALSYVEENLDGEISFERAARIAYSSQYQFQRLFSYMVGIPLAAYIRQRRLTKAAFDLQGGDRVIDVSARYGYDSPTAFNRAFQSIHGVTPTAARKPDTVLKSFPRVSFQITIKGAAEMEYRIVSKDAFRIVGVREPISTDAEENFKCVPEFWQRTAPLIPKICALMNAEPMGLLGASVADGEDENFYYIASATDMPVPEGMYESVIPASTWAIFTGSGSPGSIADLQRRVFSEWLPTSGYEWATSADIEVYLNDDPVDMKYEVWLPIVKKA